MRSAPRLTHGYARRSLRAFAENFYRGMRHPGRDAAELLWLAAHARRERKRPLHDFAIRTLRTVNARDSAA